MNNEERYTIIKQEGDVYTVVCKFCHEDEEMWDRPLRLRKSHYINGVICCGCNGSPRLTERQKGVRSARILENLGYKLEKVDSSEGKLVVHCHNEKSDNSWKVGYESLLAKGCVDPSEPHKNKLEDNEYIKRFSSAYEDGTVFERLGGMSWRITCPTCVKDEYTVVGVCCGSFDINITSLLKGSKPCRCITRFNWSKEQRQYQIQKALYDEGCDTNIEWVDDFSKKKSKSKFRWLCSKGHTNETSVSKFINSGNRCRRCNSSHNGYYPHRSGEIDYLYVVRLPDGVYKLGRSFVLEERYENINKEFKREEFKKYTGGLSVVKEYTGVHDKVFEVEQDILLELENKGMRVYKNWTTETFDVSGLSYVLDYLMNNKDLTPKR